MKPKFTFFKTNLLKFHKGPSIVLLLSFLISVNFLYAQSPLEKLIESTPSEFKVMELKTTSNEDIDLSQQVMYYKTFSIDKQGIEHIYDQKSEAISLIIPTTNGSYNLKLIQNDFKSANYKIEVNANRPFTNENAGVHYRGIIEGKTRSLAAVSVYKDEIIVSASSRDDGNLIIQKLKGSNSYVSYFDKHLLITNDAGCTVNETIAPKLSVPKFKSLEVQKIINNCVNIHIEANYELYQEFGSSITNTVNYIEGLLNVVSTVYLNDGMLVSLSYTNVWSTFNDPFTDDDSSDGLNSIRNYFNNGATLNGDLAHLLSGGNNNNGGRAYINVLCDFQTELRTAYSNINGFYNNLPVYSWDVNVFCHEMGHNIGSRHTHECVWNGNFTQIDDCGSQYFINQGDNPEPCYNSNNIMLPATGGTIMSYCHVVSTGINLANGFGPQVRDLLRSNVDNANCLGTCANNACIPPFDITVLNVTSNSANIVWQSADEIDSFKIDYEQSNGTIITIYVTENSVALNDLHPNEVYTINISSVCGENLSISQQLDIITDCGNYLNLPYQESFENDRGSWLVSGNNPSWEWGTPAKNVIQGAADGVNAWTTGGLGTGEYNADEHSFLTSPCFDFSENIEVMVKFSIWWESETSWDGGCFQYSLDNGNIWFTIGNVGDPDNWYDYNGIFSQPGGSNEGWSGYFGSGSNGWVTAKHAVNETAGQSNVKFRFAFAGDNIFHGDGIAIDDIFIWDPQAPCYETTHNLTSCFPADTGIVVQTFQDVNGCDSIITTVTTLLQSHSETIYLESCNPNDVGITSQTFINQFGCDSVVITNTSLLPSYNFVLTDMSCNPADTGTIIQNLMTYKNCDSIITFITTLSSSDAITINNQTCDPSEEGTITNTYQNQYNCDSVVTVITSLSESYDLIHTYNSCNPNDTGTVILNLMTYNGCDSIITTITNLSPSHSITINTTSCDPSQVGTETNTYVNQFNCDSVVTIHTTLVEAYNIIIVSGSCNPLDTGTNVQNLTSSIGCDSIVTTVVDLWPSHMVNIDKESCNPQDTGIISQSYTNMYGCDSIVITTTALSTTPSVTFTPLGSNNICLDDDPINLLTYVTPSGGIFSGNGITDNLFNPTTAGVGMHELVYQVVSSNDCSNSDTITVNVQVCVGISELLNIEHIVIYPNPFKETINLEMQVSNEDKVSISIIDITGRKLFLNQVNPVQNKVHENFNLSLLPEGIYTLIIEINGEQLARKIVHIK